MAPDPWMPDGNRRGGTVAEPRAPDVGAVRRRGPVPGGRSGRAVSHLVERRVHRHRREQHVLAALAPEALRPERVGTGGEDVGPPRRLHDPRVLLELGLELPRPPARVPGEDARAAHAGGERVAIPDLSGDEAEVV